LIEAARKTKYDKSPHRIENPKFCTVTQKKKTSPYRTAVVNELPPKAIIVKGKLMRFSGKKRSVKTNDINEMCANSDLNQSKKKMARFGSTDHIQ
jgi:hypothetical protein